MLNSKFDYDIELDLPVNRNKIDLFTKKGYRQIK